MSVYEEGAPHPDPRIWNDPGLPVLGICYGLQLMAYHLGGDVIPASKREYGPAVISITTEDGLFQGIAREQRVWMSHGDSIVSPPPDPAVGEDRVDAIRWSIRSGRRHDRVAVIIHTGCSRAMPWNRPSSVVIEMTAGPYSRFVGRNDVSTQVIGHQWSP